MAEEKKPKIDLKARLGKTGVHNAAQVPAAGIPVPSPSAVPTPAASGGVVPPPASTPSPKLGVPVPGIPVGPPPAFGKPTPGNALDPGNPLAAAVAPAYRAPAAASAPPPQAQRIEVDEMAVQVARKSARKQGLVMGLVAAAVVGVVGFIAGGARETSKGRQHAIKDAQSLAADVTKAKGQLELLAKKVEEGKKSLGEEKKFPDKLAHDLGGINVDFTGLKLAGVRFSGFPQATTSNLIEFITAVQAINDRKDIVVSLLTRLEKPITEQLTAGNKTTLRFVVLLGKEDPSRNPFGILAPLVKPIEANDPRSIKLPDDFTAIDPITRKNVSVPKNTSGDLGKPSAIYVLPNSIEASFPSETRGQIAQLGSQLSHIVNEVRGEKAPEGGDIITETKPGLLERADQLATALKAVH